MTLPTPFRKVRWCEEGRVGGTLIIPQVMLASDKKKCQWWLLGGINDIDAETLLRTARDVFGSEYQKMFSECFMDLVNQSVIPPPMDGKFSIDLEDAETHEIETVEEMPSSAGLDEIPEYYGNDEKDDEVRPNPYAQAQAAADAFNVHGGAAAAGAQADAAKMVRLQGLAQAFHSIMTFATHSAEQGGCGLSLLDVVSAYESVGGKVVEPPKGMGHDDDDDDEDFEDCDEDEDDDEYAAMGGAPAYGHNPMKHGGRGSRGGGRGARSQPFY